MKAVILFLALVVVAGTGRADDTNSEAALRLRASRLASISNISCEYSQEMVPTDDFVARAATDLKISREQARKQFHLKNDVTFIETNDGKFYYKNKSVLATHEAMSVVEYFSNGKDQWLLKKDTPSGGETATQVEMGRNYAPDYDGQTMMRRLLGDTILPKLHPFATQFLSDPKLQSLDEPTGTNPAWLGFRLETTTNGAETVSVTLVGDTGDQL